MTEFPAYVTQTSLSDLQGDDPRWEDDPTYTPLGTEWLAMCVEDAASDLFYRGF